MKTAIWCMAAILLTLTMANPGEWTRHGQATAAQPRERQERIDLRPRFEKGQDLRYTLELRNTGTPISLDLHGERPEQSSTVEFGLLLRTTDVTSEGEATVDLTLETIKLRAEAHGLEIEFDSSAPAGTQDDMVEMMMRSIVGATMTLTIDRTGNIKRITGGEALAALGQVGMPGMGGGAQLFGDIFSVKSGTGMVTVGESWENQDVINSGLLGRFRMNTRHTLTRMQGADALITMQGRYELDSEGARTGHVTIRDASYSGNYVWDTRAGALKQLDTSMTVRAEVELGEDVQKIRNESAVKIRKVR